jgi:hypothetical protein
MEPFGIAPISRLRVDAYTSACRVSGATATRFLRVGDVLNLLGSTHLVLEDAILLELAAPDEPLAASLLHVSLDEILLLVADSQPQARPEMRIPKRAIAAEVIIPPYHLSGQVHVPAGSRAVDGVLNAGDRFLPMTAATISSTAHPAVARQVAALAFRRDRAHVLVLADEEQDGGAAVAAQGAAEEIPG